MGPLSPLLSSELSSLGDSAGRRALFGPVVSDGLGAHDAALTGHLHRLGNDARLDFLSAPALPARYIVPANDSFPLRSTMRVTTIPALAGRAVRRPWRGTHGAVLGLRRCT